MLVVGGYLSSASIDCELGQVWPSEIVFHAFHVDLNILAGGLNPCEEYKSVGMIISRDDCFNTYLIPHALTHTCMYCVYVYIYIYIIYIYIFIYICEHKK